MTTNKNNNKTFAAKAATLLTKRGKFKEMNAETFGLMTRDERRVYPRRWRDAGHGVFFLRDGMPRIKKNLDAIGVEYTTGNIAPRGGAWGDYIELTPRGRRQCAKFAAAVRRAVKVIYRRYREDDHISVGPDGNEHVSPYMFRTQYVTYYEIWQTAKPPTLSNFSIF